MNGWWWWTHGLSLLHALYIEWNQLANGMVQSPLGFSLLNFIGWDEAKSITSLENRPRASGKFSYWVRCVYDYENWHSFSPNARDHTKCNQIGSNVKQQHESTRIFQFVSGAFYFRFNQSHGASYLYSYKIPLISLRWLISRSFTVNSITFMQSLASARSIHTCCPL